VPVRDAKQKNFKAEMPKIPGLEPRPRPPVPSRAKAVPTSRDAVENHQREDVVSAGGGVYAGPPPPQFAVIKRLAGAGVGILLLLFVGSSALKMIGNRGDSETLPMRQAAADPAPPQGAEIESSQKPHYASRSNPEVATLSELAEPWSSKPFFFRSLTAAKYVPALIIRLPGPAAQNKSYWAFSLEAPFNRCQLEYVDDLAKLSAEYGFAANHPMVVNPCSHAVFDPLQLKELPGNIMVRGAVAHGYDPRPPYGIEVGVSGDQVQALAME
jgi:hypothetical protein